MKADGSCPTCGRALPVPARQAASTSRREDVNVREMAGDDAKAPWHFKLLMALVALYLGWRLVQLVGLAF